jgi:phosphoenolpyruvate carboxykinase (ATP)
VPDEILHPRDTWQDGEAYDRQAHRLAQLFRENFSANFAGQVPEGIEASGPR